MKENQQYTIKRLRSNGVSPIIFRDFDLRFDFRCLKYEKFVRFRVLPERYNYLKN